MRVSIHPHEYVSKNLALNAGYRFSYGFKLRPELGGRNSGNELL